MRLAQDLYDWHSKREAYASSVVVDCGPKMMMMMISYYRRISKIITQAGRVNEERFH